MKVTKHKVQFDKSTIANAINNTESMTSAAAYLNVNLRTFTKIAKQYDLYKPLKPSKWRVKYELEDILNGKHPQYPSSKLSKRLVKEGLKEYKCECCGITEWNEKQISLELNHIDGNNLNNALINLELLCPNCHSQTDTYRSKKLKLK